MPWWLSVLIWIFVLIPLMAAGVAALIGPGVERRHLHELDEREAAVAGLVTHTFTRPLTVSGPVRPMLVTGTVVMGVDAWRAFVLWLVGIVGGEAPQIDRIMQRARREAVLRMKEQAGTLGAVEVVNVRLETSTISARQGNSGRGTGEILCHGTALVPR